MKYIEEKSCIRYPTVEEFEREKINFELFLNFKENFIKDLYTLIACKRLGLKYTILNEKELWLKIDKQINSLLLSNNPKKDTFRFLKMLFSESSSADLTKEFLLPCNNKYLNELDEFSKSKINEILFFFKKLNDSGIINLIKNENHSESSRMKSYSDLFKLKKSHLINPLFNHKFVNKAYHLEYDKDVGINKQFVLLEDASSSFSKSYEQSISYAFKLLLIENNVSINYIRFVDKIISSQYLKGEAELKKAFFETEHSFEAYPLNYYKALSEVAEKYKNAEVFMVSDNNDNIIQIKNFGLKQLHYFGFKDNQSMKELVKVNNGKIFTLC